jgi:hypothetical protein
MFSSERIWKGWNAKHAGKVAGYLHKTGYVRVRVCGIKYQAHRLVWLLVNGQFPAAETDHINGIPSDNRPCNLRKASTAENQRNTPLQKNNTSGFKGVSFNKRDRKYLGQLTVNRKIVHIGYFNTADEANAAVIDARVRLHGKFARWR